MAFLNFHFIKVKEKSGEKSRASFLRGNSAKDPYPTHTPTGITPFLLGSFSRKTLQFLSLPLLLSSQKFKIQAQLTENLPSLKKRSGNGFAAAPGEDAAAPGLSQPLAHWSYAHYSTGSSMYVYDLYLISTRTVNYLITINACVCMCIVRWYYFLDYFADCCLSLWWWVMEIKISFADLLIF